VATPHSGGSCKTTSRTLTIATCTQARVKTIGLSKDAMQALAMPGCVYKLMWWLGSQICVYGSLDGSRWCLNTCDSSGVSNHNVEAGHGGINSPHIQTSRWEQSSAFLCHHWTVRCVYFALRLSRPLALESDRCRPPDRPVRVNARGLHVAESRTSGVTTGPSGAFKCSDAVVETSFCPERPVRVKPHRVLSLRLRASSSHRTIRCAPPDRPMRAKIRPADRPVGPPSQDFMVFVLDVLGLLL